MLDSATTQVNSSRTRSDMWKPEEDVLLVQIVLEHVRSGSTQLRAFEEAGNQLGRSSAACGFRWNGVLRKQFEEPFSRAKEERQTNRTLRRSNPHAYTTTSSRAMKDVIHYLETRAGAYRELVQKARTLRSECDDLRSRVVELEKSYAQPSGDSDIERQLEEDALALVHIAARARKVFGQGT